MNEAEAPELELGRQELAIQAPATAVLCDIGH
jgi:hypothetical protein